MVNVSSVRRVDSDVNEDLVKKFPSFIDRFLFDDDERSKMYGILLMLSNRYPEDEDLNREFDRVEKYTIMRLKQERKAMCS